MANPTIAIELTPKERALILRYGYPFDQIKEALLAAIPGDMPLSGSGSCVRCLRLEVA